MRVLILHRSQARLLMHNRHDNVGSWGRSGCSLPPSGNNSEVFHAFARFRERHVQLGALVAPGLQGKSIEVGTLGSQSEAATRQRQQQCYWWDSTVVPKGAPPDLIGSCKGGVLCKVERRFAVAQEAAVRMVVAGELLHLFRPLVHALALRRWGRASWRPWLLALGMDLASQQLSLGGARLSQRAAEAAAYSPAARNTSLALLFSLQALRWGHTERDELARRRVQLAWVLLRDPLFGRYVQPALEAWARAASRVPLLGGLSARAVEILVGWQQYFSFSCSS